MKQDWDNIDKMLKLGDIRWDSIILFDLILYV